MNKYEMTQEELRLMISDLDDTSGYIIKTSTLKFLVEKAVNQDRAAQGRNQEIHQEASHPTAFDMVMHEQMPKGQFPGRTVPVRVESENGQVWIRPLGYGDCTSVDGHGWPIGVELANNEVRVMVWADINEEDPSHTISVEGANEDKRMDICAGCGKEQLFSDMPRCEACGLGYCSDCLDNGDAHKREVCVTCVITP